MMVRKINGFMWVQYGHLVSKFRKHVGFNVEDQESYENSSEIGNATVNI